MERVDWLQAGMDTLSDRDRESIRLRDLEEMSLTATAEAFELSESAAKSTHLRARRRLAGALRSMERRPRVSQNRKRRPGGAPRVPGTARRKSFGHLRGATAGAKPEKIAVVAPIPKAKVSTAVSANPDCAAVPAVRSGHPGDGCRTRAGPADRDTLL
jgi:hypothetical protein